MARSGPGARLAHVAAAAAAVVAGVGAASAQLMVPDLTGRRIMLFSAVDGSLIDANWIAEANAVGWTFPSHPVAVEMVGNEIWLSGRWFSEGFNGILRVDYQSNFIGRISTNEWEPRGMGTDGTRMHVAMENRSDGTGQITTYALDGTETRSVEANQASDVEFYQGGMIAGRLGSDTALERINTFGHSLGDFVTLDDFLIDQVVVQPDDSVITVNSLNFANPLVQGVYHYNADGTLRTFVGTRNAGTWFLGVTPRGAVLLENGSYFIVDARGVYLAAADGAGGFTFTEVLSGVNAWHIGVFSPPVDDDLRISAIGSSDVVAPIDSLTYTVFVRNAGETTLTNVNVATTLSGLVQYTSSSLGSHDMSDSGGVHTASFTSIAPLATESYTITVAPQALGAATTTAAGSADQADPDPSNNTAAIETTVNNIADLLITVDDLTDPVTTYNGAFSYQIQVLNFGPDDADNVTVVLELDPQTTFVGTSAGAHDGSATGGVVTANLGTVPNGLNTFFTVDVLAGDVNGATYTATATASSDATEFFPSDNTESATTLLTVPPPNDDCDNAVPLTLDAPQSGTTLGATFSTSVTCGHDPLDVWYEFVPEPNVSYRFTASFISVSGGVTLGSLAAFNDCPGMLGTEVACVTDTSQPSIEVTADAAATPILVRVGSRQNRLSNFELTAERLCACETDGNAAQVDVFDLLAYLDLWFAGDTAADLDGTPGVDVFDLLSFLDCWFPASAGAAC